MFSHGVLSGFMVFLVFEYSVSSLENIKGAGVVVFAKYTFRFQEGHGALRAHQRQGFKP